MQRRYMSSEMYVVYNKKTMVVVATFDTITAAGVFSDKENSLDWINCKHPDYKQLLPQLVWPKGITDPLPRVELAERADAKIQRQKEIDLDLLNWFKKQGIYSTGSVTLVIDYDEKPAEEVFTVIRYLDNGIYRVSIGVDVEDAIINRDTQKIVNDVSDLVDTELLPKCTITLFYNEFPGYFC